MARFKLFVSVLVIIGVCTLAATSFAKPAPKPKCPFNGDYSFFFWSPDEEIAGVGFFSVSLSRATNCRSGVVLPGGIIECNFDESVYQDFIEEGAVFIETDGEGTMEIETNSSGGICGTGKNALELDISIAQNGRRVLFNSNAVELVRSGTTPNAGFDHIFAGRAGKCFNGEISGCYDIHFWEPTEPLAGDCTVCLAGGFVTGGSCRCNSDHFEYLSEIEVGGYNPGPGCESSTGFLTFDVSSDEICGITSTLYLDFAPAAGGAELFGACDGFNLFDCAFEGWKQ